MPEQMTDEELYRMIREEFNLPAVPDQVKGPIPPAAPLSTSVESGDPTTVTIAEFVKETGVLRRIRIGHGEVPKNPFLEFDVHTGLAIVRFNRLLLWTNALGPKTPVVKYKHTTFSTEKAFQVAQQRTIVLPPHLTGLQNAFLPFSPTQLMVAEGESEAGELLNKFVNSLSLQVPEDFKVR